MQKNQLGKELWEIANDLRGQMDADKFKDYILNYCFIPQSVLKNSQLINKFTKRNKLTNIL